MKVQTCQGSASPGHHYHHHQQQVQEGRLAAIHKPVAFKMSAGGGDNAPYSEKLAIKSCFKKLRQLVPSLQSGGGRELTEIELIQHVIDYIRSLEQQLDTHPINLLLHGAYDPAATGLDSTTSGLRAMDINRMQRSPDAGPASTACLPHRTPLIDRHQHTTTQPHLSHEAQLVQQQQQQRQSPSVDELASWHR